MSESAFSRRTVVAAAHSLQVLTNNEITILAQRLGPPISLVASSGTCLERVAAMVNLYDQSPAMALSDGRLLSLALVEEAAKHVPPDRDTFPDAPWKHSGRTGPSEEQEEFLACLALDGFTVAGCKLQPMMPADLDLAEGQSEIEQLMERFGFVKSRGHLQQALDNYGRGSWAAGNGQLRSMFEGLMNDICDRLDHGANLPSSINKRAHLAKLGFLSQDLNEWSPDGKNFIEGLMKRLHPHGSHPGLSDPADATFRLHLVLVTSRLLLKRLEAWR